MRKTLALVGWLLVVACRRTPEPAPGVAAAAPVAADEKAEEPAAPLVITGRRIDITAGPKGYDPERMRIEAGEDVTLVFTRTVKSHCLSEIMIPSLKVKLPLPLNRPVAIPFSPTRSGDVAYSCGMDMIHGTIAVQ